MNILSILLGFLLTGSGLGILLSVSDWDIWWGWTLGGTLFFFGLKLIIDGEINDKIENVKYDIKSDLESKIEDLEREISDVKSDLSSKIDDKIEEVKDDLNSEINDIKNELDDDGIE